MGGARRAGVSATEVGVAPADASPGSAVDGGAAGVDEEGLRAELLAAWRAERRRARAWDRATVLGSFATLALLLTLLFGAGYDQWWLVVLSLFAVFTRACGLVVLRVFLYPRLLAELSSPVPERRRAARAVAEENRLALLYDIAVERHMDCEPAALEALSLDAVAAWPEVADIERWHRIGRRTLAAWVVVAALVGTLLVVGLP